MAFKQQKLTKEDVKYVNKFKIRNGYGGGIATLNEHTEVTIDRERNIYFIDVGGRGEKYDPDYPPTVGWLIWNDKLTRVEFYWKWYNKKTDEINKIINISYKIVSIRSHISLENKGEEIKQLIKDAIVERDRLWFGEDLGIIEFVEVAGISYSDMDLRKI